MGALGLIRGGDSILLRQRDHLRQIGRVGRLDVSGKSALMQRRARRRGKPLAANAMNVVVVKLRLLRRVAHTRDDVGLDPLRVERGAKLRQRIAELGIEPRVDRVSH